MARIGLPSPSDGRDFVIAPEQVSGNELAAGQVGRQAVRSRWAAAPAACGPGSSPT